MRETGTSWDGYGFSYTGNEKKRNVSKVQLIFKMLFFAMDYEQAFCVHCD